MMNQNEKIFIAGRAGLVGSAIERKFRKEGFTNIVGLRSCELDMRNQRAVFDYFKQEKPDYVVLAAAKVGGIMANISSPAEFLYDNLAIQNNIIEAAHQYGVKKLLFLASSCIYPREARQPMKEEYLLDGKPEPTNEGYALAKIVGLKMCEYYNKQYGTDYISVMPCNLYGVGDNFNPINSHVVAATIRKVHEAKIRGDKQIVVWGTGKARRELLYVDDMADASYHLFLNYSGNEFFNVGTGVDYSITELTKIVMEVIGLDAEIVYDTSKPDGMPQKLLDVSKLKEKGWVAKTDIRQGIEKTYQYYLKNILSQ